MLTRYKESKLTFSYYDVLLGYAYILYLCVHLNHIVDSTKVESLRDLYTATRCGTYKQQPAAVPINSDHLGDVAYHIYNERGIAMVSSIQRCVSN